MKSYPHSNVYCRVARSTISGVGLVSVIGIPRDTIIFSGKEPPADIVPRKLVDGLPSGHRKLYEDFGVLDGENYIVPSDLSELTVGWFFNNSKTPNVACRTIQTRSGGFDFYALDYISAGTELTLDYTAYEKLYLALHHQKISGRKKPARM